MPGPRVSPELKSKYFLLRQGGATMKDAAAQTGISYNTGRGLEQRLTGAEHVRSFRLDGSVKPIPYKQLSNPAKRGWNDIGYFAKRYFGLVLMPFHYQDTERVVAALDSPEKEFYCINIAPGTGKTTFYSRVLPAWLTVRDRTITGLLGSAVHNLAKRGTIALRSDFMRTTPIQSPSDGLRDGWAVDAKACLTHDYGRFRPESYDEDTVWRQDSFVVIQHDDVPLATKEHTWQAFGRDTSVLGTRVRFAVWDDLYDPGKVRSPEVKQALFDWWTQTAEQRLEPSGVLLLVGQRIDPDDIYAYALSQRRPLISDNPDDEEADDRELETIPKYNHIVHEAHHEDKCKGRLTHSKDADPWPVGCLLYPKRLKWRELSELRYNSPDIYEVTYQQRDYAMSDVLVHRIWVDGGLDKKTGVEYIGCWDMDRGRCELPRGLAPPIFSIATADPSPTKYWAIEWWAYHPASEQRFLLDIKRARMDAPDLLDYDYNNNQFVGLMDEWQKRSISLRLPISTWVIEVNAAQKFLLQYDHVRRWRSLYSVNIMPHTTGVNKSDPDLGIPSLRDHWKFGRVRLPGSPEVYRDTMHLVNEACRYNLRGKQVGTDDCVMAEWFFEWKLPQIAKLEDDMDVEGVPSWLPALSLY